MSDSVVLGIDPGGQFTGVVMRDGRNLLDHAVLRRQKNSIEDYLERVLGEIGSIHARHSLQGKPVTVAVEGLNPPIPHLGLTNVQGLIDTARILGAIQATWPHAVLVEPGGHGSTPDLPKGRILDAWMAQHFPAALLGAREIGGSYTGILKHARSSWDVSLAAERQMLVGAV